MEVVTSSETPDLPTETNVSQGSNKSPHINANVDSADKSAISTNIEKHEPSKLPTDTVPPNDINDAESSDSDNEDEDDMIDNFF
jgi:hypothetical protein